MKVSRISFVGLLFLLFIIGISFSVAEELKADSNTLLLFHFNKGKGNTADDAGDSGNNGVIHGAVWVEGKTGKALQFDGEDDYVEVPYHNKLNITNAITIEAWIKPGTLSGEQVIVGGGSGFEQPGYCLGIFNNKVRFNLDDGPGQEMWFDSKTALEANRWHHVAVTWEKSEGLMRIYIDGVEDTNTAVFKGPV